jgi:DNA primase
VEQALLLERLTDNVVLALDADPAGQAATERANEVFEQLNIKMIEAVDHKGQTKSYIDPAKSFKKSLRVAVLPAGKDPDECIRQSPEQWRQAVERSVPMLQFYFDRVLESLDLTIVDNKKRAAAKLLPMIARLDNAMDRGLWLKYLAGKLGVEQKYLEEAIGKFVQTKPVESRAVQLANKPSVVKKRILGREELLSRQLLALALRYPAQLPYLVDYIRPEQLSGADNQNLYKNLVIYYTQGTGNALGSFLFNDSDFKAWLMANQQSGAEQVDMLAILAENEFAEYDQARSDVQIKAIIKQLKQAYLKERLRVITSLITEMEADANANPQELTSLLTEFNHLSRELAEFLN